MGRTAATPHRQLEPAPWAHGPRFGTAGLSFDGPQQRQAHHRSHRGFVGDDETQHSLGGRSDAIGKTGVVGQAGHGRIGAQPRRKERLSHQRGLIGEVTIGGRVRDEGEPGGLGPRRALTLADEFANRLDQRAPGP